MNRQTLTRIVLFAALVAAIGGAWLYRDQLNVAALESWVKNAGALGPLLFIALYGVATVLFLPGSLLTLAGGALFGPVWGTLYCLTGATLGATLAFLIARYLAQDWVRQRAGGILGKLLDGVDAEGWKFVAFVRLVPLFPFILLNYALGLTRIGLVPYVAASFIFMFPGALAFTYLGYAGREAVAGGEGLIQKGLLALALLALVAFLPRLIKRLRGAPAEAGAGLSSAELKQRLERRDDITVLDVRTAKDYAGDLGHIDGALNIPLDELPRRLPELDRYRDRPLAVVCRTNRMSGKAVQMLRETGFKQALLVNDGMVGWRQAQGQAVPAASGNECSAMPVPGGVSAGTGKTVTIVIQNAPYQGDNKAWHALRFAGAALAEDMKVRVHLLDDGAVLARRGHRVPDGAVDLEKLLTELMECGLEVRACAMAMNECKLDERDLIAGVQTGSMTALAGWVKESDIVLTF
ncbi:sulfurtransferase [Sulfuricaulis limicola]|uniref:TVP38/TMEM64 family membrane protein n=1 Tax=Sulfuricaulis limicola TaxID=1620215 RepID=A0A1B4XJJ6_9GAMM|nr:VTT domain-containing protein [Sulfuricaulis limicola]BAV34976.1 sulfurtransferase [Sulfuricaulis limicola]